MRAEEGGRRTQYLYHRTVKGNSYLYFRMPGGKLVRLPDDEHSADFRRSYDACIKVVKKPLIPDERKPARTDQVAFVGGTIGAAIKRYRASPQFEKLKPSSRATYDCALKGMRDLIGDARLCDLDVDTVDIYSERVAKDHGPGMAHIHVVMIGNIWKACRKFPDFKVKGKSNPTLEAEKYRKVRNPYKPWAEDAQKLFMETAPEELRLAKLLLHFSGQRGGDAVKMRWADFDGEGIFVLPEKTATADDPEPKYSLCPKPLLDALLAQKKQGNLGEFILTNAWGKPWANAKTLSIAIRRHLMKLGLVRKGTRTITMHGLRKNAASDVSALLVGSAGVKSVTHHKSNAMADYYAKHAEQIAMNRKVVEKWNEAIAEKAERAAAKRRATLKRVR